MAINVDERAVLGKNVELGEGVTISPFAVIEENVTIGRGTSIGASAYIGSNTTIGEDCRIFNGASIGTIAQDLKYRDEDASLTIGNRAMIREFCTINKGTSENNGVTSIGDDAALLAYSHVAHDCVIGNHFVASNNLALAGHVTVEDHVTCGGFVSAHQFVTIGAHSFIGAWTFANMDVVPFSLVANGEKGAYIAGINKVGLERRGFEKSEISLIKKAFRNLFRKSLPIEEAINIILAESSGSININSLIDFVNSSERGLLRMKK